MVILNFLIYLDEKCLKSELFSKVLLSEPSSRLLVMVTSENSKLNIYEDTKLLWSCDLNHKAISISRCFLNALSGGIVTLSEDGTVIVSYLGTEPDLNSNASPITETIDPGEVQLQIDEVEKSLQKVLDAKEGIG